MILKSRKRRHRKIRVKINGTKENPRLCVFRSNKHIYAQLIDDSKGKILASANDFKINIDKENKEKNKKVIIAFKVGEEIAKKTKELKIKKVLFDRGGYKYHGRVKAVAEGARQEGLKF